MPAPLRIIRRARAAAAVVCACGIAYLAQAPGLAEAAPYLGVLAGAGAGSAFLAAARLWSGGHLDGRIIALSLSVAGLTGQLLNVYAGLPGAGTLQGGLSGFGVLVAVLELIILALLAVDAARRSTAGVRRHPYAL